jgi:hypothetical protein
MTSTLTRTLAAGAVTVGLLGLAAGLASAASAATPDTTTAPAAVTSAAAQAIGPVGSSSSERVANLTSYRMRLQRIDGDGNFEGRPADGTVTAPGQSADFEVQRRWLDGQHDVAHYDFLDANGTVIGTGDLVLKLTGGVFDTSMAFTPTTAGLPITSTLNAGKNVLTLLDTGTQTIEVSASDPRASLVREMDLESDGVTSSFVSHSQQLTSSPTALIGSAVDNTSYTVTNSTVIDQSETSTATNTLGVKFTVTGKFGKMIEASIEIQYSHSWIDSTTFDQKYTMNIPPRTEAWLDASDPTLTYTGVLTVKVGNTTWVIDDAQFTQPDTDPNRGTLYTMHQRPLDQPATAAR